MLRARAGQFRLPGRAPHPGRSQAHAKAHKRQESARVRRAGTPYCARVVVAGTQSGVGKTTIATGIMAALTARGLRVQAFKVGPDFIDPTFHTVATGRPGRNLDGWMLSRETNLEILGRAGGDADAVVIEGVMGLFDGKDSASLSGTTAEMAIWLDAPVVLVVDAQAMAGSIAAIVNGFDTLAPELPLAGVIANRTAGAKHTALLREAIDARCRARWIGGLPADAQLTLPERYLGLHLAGETLTAERLARLAAVIEEHLDLDRLLEIGMRPLPETTAAPVVSPVRTRIGVARDSAFCFYYEDNLDLLRRAGAELVPFRPADDSRLPRSLDALYLGGGYPELHAAALSRNQAMRSAIADFVAGGGRVYAECGGLMYLTRAIVDADQREWPMVGVFPTRARMQKRLARIGYVEVEYEGKRARGHEFRYSTIDPMPAEVERVYGGDSEGYRVKGAVGSYAHLHFLSCPALAERLAGVLR